MSAVAWLGWAVSVPYAVGLVFTWALCARRASREFSVAWAVLYGLLLAVPWPLSLSVLAGLGTRGQGEGE